MKQLFALISIITFSATAQIKGIVKDSLTGKPIPYVNIWVQNLNSSSTSQEDGTFEININEKSKNLIFNAIGFEKKSVATGNAKIVLLKPVEYQLDEVVIVKRFGTKQIEIGKTDSQIYQSVDNGPRIDVKYFPYFPRYKKTKYLKKVTIFADNRVENATIKLHFYTVDSRGFPSEEMLNKNLIVTLKKGTANNVFDLTDFNLKMPKTGLFVGFEKLFIEKNKLEQLIVDKNTNTTKVKISYFPFVLYNYVERDFIFTYSGGEWNKQINKDNSSNASKILVYEPAINLILTN
ncbi:MAG: carboxypeptidase-like regulatory domain-containing protein [Flavobacterium sp.]|nr:carboxypeptidase-like regulatory domain-containing protein [Flavobacterium sp.]